MFKRIRKAWYLAGEKEQTLDLLKKAIDDGVIAWAQKTDDAFINTAKLLLEKPVEGDGKAEFFSEPTPEEELEYQREQAGTLPWYKRIKNML